MEKCTYCVQRIERKRIDDPDRRPHHRRRRARDRLPARLPTRTPSCSASLNDPNSKRLAAARRPAPLRSAARDRHPPAHRLPRARAQPQPRPRQGAELAMASPHDSAVVSRDPIRSSHAPSSRARRPTRPSTTACSQHVWRGAGKGWWACFARGARRARPAGHRAQLRRSYKGIGTWGNNIPVGWAFGIINFVWWIGIGHAGTLISAILLLLPAEVAHVDQPLRRGDDPVRGHLRAALPAHSTPAGPGSRPTGCCRTRASRASGRSSRAR